MTHVAYARKSTVRRTEPKEEDEPKEMLKRTKLLSWVKEDVKQDCKIDAFGKTKASY